MPIFMTLGPSLQVFPEKSNCFQTTDKPYDSDSVKCRSCETLKSVQGRTNMNCRFVANGMKEIVFI